MVCKYCIVCLAVNFLAENVCYALKINNRPMHALPLPMFDWKSSKSRLVAARVDVTGNIPYSSAVMHSLRDERRVAPTVRSESNIFRFIASAGTGFLYVMVTVRTASAIESADQLNSPLIRLLALVPLAILLGANFLGFGVFIVRPPNYKKYVKPIIALNFIREIAELISRIVYVCFKLFWGQLRTPAYETSIVFIIQNFFISILSYQFLKAHWVQ